MRLGREILIVSEPDPELRFDPICPIGTLTVGRDRRFAVFVVIFGGADRLLYLFDERCEPTSRFTAGVGMLALTRLSAVMIISIVLMFDMILLLCVPSEEASDEITLVMLLLFSKSLEFEEVM